MAEQQAKPAQLQEGHEEIDRQRELAVEIQYSRRILPYCILIVVRLAPGQPAAPPAVEAAAALAAANPQQGDNDWQQRRNGEKYLKKSSEVATE